MLPFDFDASVGYWTWLAAHAIERAMNEELNRVGITHQQWQVLAWLVLDGELTQAGLAERMRIEAPTLVGILDRMERDGWVARVVSPTDRRKKIIRPCERVGPVWAQMAACAHRVRARAVEGVPPEDVARLIDTLRRVAQNLRSPHIVPSPEGEPAAGGA